MLAALFQLDNLTMRLRRHAESVLVLAGRESGRRAREPLAVADVVRTACAQIDAYDRVAVDAVDDPLLTASAVVPLAHLVAELLENATRYSDPRTEVAVRVGRDGGDVTIAISDSGLGMDATVLAEARERLHAADPATPGGRIGLAVVGRIARRLGVAVDLDSVAGGTTATVRVPERMLVADDDATTATGGTGATPTVPPVAPEADPPTAWHEVVQAPALAGEGFAPAVVTPLDAPLTRRGAHAAPEPLDGPEPLASGGFLPAAAPPVPAAAPVPDPAPPVSDPAPPAFAPGPLPAEPAFQAFSPQPAPPAEVPAAFVPVPSAPAEPAPPEPAPAPARPEPAPGFAPVPPAAVPSQTDGWFVPAAGDPGRDAADPALRDEVLAELGRLSGYTPARVAAEPAPALERRTARVVAEPLAENRGPADRDASTVRRRFSAFQSATGRGRRR